MQHLVGFLLKREKLMTMNKDNEVKRSWIMIMTKITMRDPDASGLPLNSIEIQEISILTKRLPHRLPLFEHVLSMIPSQNAGVKHNMQSFSTLRCPFV